MDLNIQASCCRGAAGSVLDICTGFWDLKSNSTRQPRHWLTSRRGYISLDLDQCYTTNMIPKQLGTVPDHGCTSIDASWSSWYTYDVANKFAGFKMCVTSTIWASSELL